MYVFSRSQWPRSLRRGSTAAHLLGLWVRIPQGLWMSVSCECRSLCVGLILPPEESYRVCVTEWSREASIMRSHGPLGAVATWKKNYVFMYAYSMCLCV